MDVITAFMNEDVYEVVYMDGPEYFKRYQSNGMVGKLERALYGLRKPPTQRFAKTNSFLVDDPDFRSSQYDPCLCTGEKGPSMVLIYLYVGDLPIGCNSIATLRWFKSSFPQRFEMTDCGEALVLLGFQIC